MADPFLGEIRMFGGNFAPNGWALCNGQQLSIAQNAALFSILGTTFGGNGVSTFGLPNLCGQVPMHWGQSPSGTQYQVGETTGAEQVTLLASQMPQHNHGVNGNATPAGAASPSGGVPATLAFGRGITGNLPNAYASAPDGSTTMSPQMIQASGGSQPHSNMQPSLCVTFIIALNGIFPSRS